MATLRKASLSVFRVLIFLPFASLTLSGTTVAEVITDGSLGGLKGPVSSGTVPGVGTTTYHITDTLGKRAGQNLFHSFDKFNVLTNESATFTAPGDIRNVVSRVTGGTLTWIDGTLRSTVQGAHLYFLNPWGVVFGPNASLDVKGSFHVSTADYLRFEDAIRFYSSPGAADQVLSTASPAAFGFLSANPASVQVLQSFLEVPVGETLSVIGGNIELSAAFLNAPGGRINLASMATPGEVIPSSAGEAPDLQVRPLNASGVVSIDGSLLNSGGTPVGTILIRSGRLVLDHGSWVTADTYGDGPGGVVDIVTGSLDSSGGSAISSDTQGMGEGGRLVVVATDRVHLNGSYLSSASWASGDAGSIALSTPSLLVENEAMIYGDSFGEGKAGDVSIVSGKLSLVNGGSVSSSAYGETGNGGNLSITATESLSISGTGPYGLHSSLENRTAGAGHAGRIQVATPLLNIGESGSISAETLGTGRAGDIDVIAETVHLSAGGRISNGAFGTTGKGGNISVRASDAVTIAGKGTQDIPSGIFTFAAAAGEAGNILLSAPQVVLSNGASIGADTVGEAPAGNIELTVQRLALSGGATISSGSAGGSGGGGNIHISSADAVSLSGLFSEISTSTVGAGQGGDIVISSSTLTLQDHAALHADTLGTGSGGDIAINVTSLAMSGGSRISSSAYDGTGDGGQVTVRAEKDISLIGAFSGIYSVSSGQGNGGDINLSAAQVRLTDGAQLSASSRATGNAGNIGVATTGSFLSRNSALSTSSDNADGGNIKIAAPDIVHLKDSEVTASVGGGPSTVGGNISIDPQFVILDHSKIIANANEGQGGNIQIVTHVFLADPHSIVDASSALGIDGTVDIRAPITEINGTLVPLGEDFISAIELLREPCMARIRGGKYSSFIVTGRDGLPMEPGRWLPSPMPQ